MRQTALAPFELRHPIDVPQAVPAHSTFRYMARFRCIGAACETTCCKGWEIQVDESHYKKLKKTMARSEDERQKFDAGHRRYRGSDRSRGKFALVVLQPSGECSYLQSDRLCSLQATYGEEALSDTCAVYPRAVSQSGMRQELTGAVSCPEVARQLLLREDAMDRVAADGSSFTRGMVSQSITSPAPTPYLRNHEALTNLVCDLLSAPEHRLEVRLFFVSYFANRTAAYLSKNAIDVDDQRLADDVERIQHAAFQRELANKYDTLEVAGTMASQLVLHVLSLRAAALGQSPFRKLLEDVLISYAPTGALRHARDEATSEASVPASAFFHAYRERKAFWEREHGGRLDVYFANYAKNYWVKEWYARSPNLLVHTQSLLVRMALLRFLLFGHPALRAAESIVDHAERQRELDRVVVEVVHRFSRHFEHDATLVRNLEAAFSEQGMQTLAHAICLTSF